MSPDANDWIARYAGQRTPWDHGGPHPQLKAWVASAPGKGRSACVPGCGTAHDAAALAAGGWRTVGIDFVAGAPADQNRATIEGAGGELIVGDALKWRPREGFDLFFEHTFFCAIDPDRRSDWGQLVRRCLRPGGQLLALAFPIGRPGELDGPPFGYEVEDLLAALGEDFDLLEDRAVDLPIADRSWPERWVRCQRR